MAVRHTPPNSGESVVHKGQKGGKTGCGENTNEHPSHWSNTTSPVMDVRANALGAKVIPAPIN